MDDDVTVHLEPDLDEQVGKMPELHLSARNIAEKIAAVARANAPVDTGLYQSRIEVQDTKTGARVFAADQKSAWIEFGIPSHNQPARWVLRTAAESLGLKFKKKKG
jgi:hypothetical protein